MSGHAEKVEQLKKDFLQINNYNMPVHCQKCGGIMVFKGVGEYQCEDCGFLDYDDYGKVRNYIEKYGSATTAQVSRATGVTQKSIREMLKESRLEIALNSSTFLQCEMCGTSIRSGRLCPRCEANYHKNLEEQARFGRHANYTGFSAEKPAGEDGSKRFVREK